MTFSFFHIFLTTTLKCFAKKKKNRTSSFHVTHEFLSLKTLAAFPHMIYIISNHNNAIIVKDSKRLLKNNHREKDMEKTQGQAENK